MGLISKELARTQIVGTVIGSADVIYTNLTTKDAIITKITMHNTHSSAIAVTLLRVLDSAGVAGAPATTDAFWFQSIPAYDTVILGSDDLTLPLTDTGDTLQAFAATTAKVNIFVDGWTQPDQT